MLLTLRIVQKPEFTDRALRKMINFYYILGIFSVILVIYYFYLDIVYREKFRNDLLKTIEEEIEEEIEEDSDGDEEGKEKSK